MDSAHDDIKLLFPLQRADNTYFIIKRNPRKKTKEMYLEEAKEMCKEPSIPRFGLEIYRYEKTVEREFSKEKQLFREVTIVKSEEYDEYFQRNLLPKITLESFWVKLDADIKMVAKLYHDQGTMEQYHSEFKTDLRLERLPSQKFLCNETILQMGEIAFNLLRNIGDQMLNFDEIPKKKKRGMRLKINTVIQNLMYMAGHFIRRKTEAVLKIYRKNAWQTSFIRLMSG